ncbi:hypothetical protein [Asticcacaulis sp.]|uniref:hypothetical protein n=1 Tax=Asticcacaulis sp. TaxID=1872648 RepID=UPI0031E1571F
MPDGSAYTLTNFLSLSLDWSRFLALAGMVSAIAGIGVLIFAMRYFSRHFAHARPGNP